MSCLVASRRAREKEGDENARVNGHRRKREEREGKKGTGEGKRSREQDIQANK